MLVFPAFAQPANVPGGEPALTRFTDPATQVEVIFVEEEFMFPVSWYETEINAQATSLASEEIERSLAVVGRCFSKYPEGLIAKHLKKVYVVKSLEFFGTSYGGTYAANTVFLSNKGEDRGYTDEYIEKVFHAEFSSILYGKYAQHFDTKAWQAANDRNVEYGSGGMLALKTGKSSEVFLSTYHKVGFLNQYAQSSVENDFNSFAKNLFVPTKEFWNLTEEYNRLNQKLELILAFYQAIDPQFSREFFENLTAQ